MKPITGRYPTPKEQCSKPTTFSLEKNRLLLCPITECDDEPQYIG